jgi:hypothetical protein
MSRLADARKVFKRNQIYSVNPSLDGHRELKYFDTAMVNGEIIHAFGKAEGRDMTERSMPKVVAWLDDSHLNEYTFTPFYAARVSEIAIARGTLAPGPATKEGKQPRKEADPKLPIGIARTIESYITGESEREKSRKRSGGRRRKTRRAKNLR